jgi:hypothetical protein
MMKEFLQEWFSPVLAVCAAVWVTLRFVFEPHVRRVVRAAGVKALEERTTKLEETMREVEATMEARDERDTEFRVEMRDLAQRQTRAMEAIVKEVSDQGKDVAGIRGRLDEMGRRT